MFITLILSQSKRVNYCFFIVILAMRRMSRHKIHNFVCNGHLYNNFVFMAGTGTGSRLQIYKCQLLNNGKRAKVFSMQENRWPDANE